MYAPDREGCCCSRSTICGASTSSRSTICAKWWVCALCPGDPLVEYKAEGFQLFGEMTSRLREMVTRQMMRLEVMVSRPSSATPGDDGASFQSADREDEIALASMPFPGRSGTRPGGGRGRGMVRWRRRIANPQDPATWGRVVATKPAVRVGQEVQALPRPARLSCQPA